VGIEVSVTKVVTINDQHEEGVDTSIAANPTRGKTKGLPVLHVFSRNSKGGRRDDGNPLIHALKGKRGFSIQPFWESQLLMRAANVLQKAGSELQGFDYCVPVPSSSPFCYKFANVVSHVCGAPVLNPTFVRKKYVGEVLADAQMSPPKVRQGLKVAYTSQLHAWEKLDPNANYQAKDVEVALRHLFSPFTTTGNPPDLSGKKVLIIDDLFASGSSLLSMRGILQNGLGATAAGVCFLSGA